MNIAESLTRRMLGMEDLSLPPEYSVTKDLATDIARRFVDPLAAIYRRGQEKSAMPLGQQVVEQAKDTGAVMKGLAKTAGRVATTAFDTGRIAGQTMLGTETRGTDWSQVPVLRNTPSVQRTAYEKTRTGTSPAQAVAEGARDASLDALITYGAARVVGGAADVAARYPIEKVFSGRAGAAPKAPAPAPRTTQPRATPRTTQTREPNIRYSPYDPTTRTTNPTVRQLQYKSSMGESNPVDLFKMMQEAGTHTKRELQVARKNAEAWLKNK